MPVVDPVVAVSIWFANKDASGGTIEEESWLKEGKVGGLEKAWCAARKP